MKRCSGDCKKTITVESFNRNRAIRGGLSTVCKACAKLAQQRRWATPEAKAERTVYDRNRKARVDPARRLISIAKNRAKMLGIAFDIDPSDVVVPEQCPVLGIPLIRGGRKNNEGNPSIDRIDPSRGYVKGNVWVISFKANSIKRDATLAELEMLVAAVRARYSAASGNCSDSSSGSSGAVAA